MAVVFYHAEHRHGEPKLVKNALCRLRVGYAAIYEQQLFMICEHAVTQYVEKLLGDLDGLQVQDNDKRIIIKAYTCECYGQIVNWLSSGMKEGFRQDMIRLCRLREGEVRELLVRSTKI